MGRTSAAQIMALLLCASLCVERGELSNNGKKGSQNRPSSPSRSRHGSSSNSPSRGTGGLQPKPPSFQASRPNVWAARNPPPSAGASSEGSFTDIMKQQASDDKRKKTFAEIASQSNPIQPSAGLTASNLKEILNQLNNIIDPVTIHTTVLGNVLSNEASGSSNAAIGVVYTIALKLTRAECDSGRINNLAQLARSKMAIINQMAAGTVVDRPPIMAAIPWGTPRKAHAEYRVLQRLRGSEAMCIIIYTSLSPCSDSCLNTGSSENILRPLQNLRAAENYKAVVFGDYYEDPTAEYLNALRRIKASARLYQCTRTQCQELN